MTPFDQATYAVRLDWGATGAREVSADVAVVVDVLSFSTAVTVAVERGTRVYPYRWRDDDAAAYAARLGATLALGRLEAARADAPEAVSLSPARLREGEAPDRLVLPSPNGSTIAAALQESGATVAVGCLRNASAVARWLAEHRARGATVSVIAAGERWATDDSLRPALEDHLGAGAILDALRRLDPYDATTTAPFSPEADAAADLAAAGRDRLAAMLTGCASGRELTAKGFDADVAIAAELDASMVVPALVGGAFVAEA